MSDPTLFRGTPSHYDKYHPQYAEKVFDLIRSKLNLDGSGILLDLGCGTGPLVARKVSSFQTRFAMGKLPLMVGETTR